MAKQPNILLFITDDHAPWTLPCYGNSDSVAPTFDRLAAKGVVFENAFTPTPVCSPGRACLLTGLTASQHGVHDWIAMHDPECQERDWLAGQLTLSEILTSVGYRCGLAGKWHIGRDFEKPRGYDWYFGFAMQGGHQGITTYIKDGRAQVRRGNVTEYVTDEALDFLSSTEKDRPFLLHVGYTDTHSPYVGQDPELVDRFRDATFSDIEVGEPHPYSWNEGFPEGSDIHDDEIRIRHATQYAAVADIDRHMRRIIDQLESDGRLNDTIIIYTSDHGLSLGQNGFWGKGNGTRPNNMYDVSIRVPLIVSGPGISAGRIDRCVDHFDTFQSIVEHSGADSSRLRSDTTYPGESFVPLLSDPDSPWSDICYGEYGDLRMIRTPTHKYIRRYASRTDELYDLVSDPTESTDVIGDPGYAKVAASLADDLETFFRRHQDPDLSGLKVKELPRHNTAQKPAQTFSSEAWRDGIRESRGY
jgi:choline-sulfatase